MRLRVRAALGMGLSCGCAWAVAQAPADSGPQTTAPYSLTVPVNEVEVRFHAADGQDSPVLDLKPEEMDLFDNETGPGKVLRMELLRDRTVRVAVVIDTSGSVAGEVAESRARAREAINKLVVGGSDAGAVIELGRSRHVVEGWTGQASTLTHAIDRVGAHVGIGADGTGLYDTLFSTCLYEFGAKENEEAAKAIFLFSDGVDTASQMTKDAAIDRCRKSRVAVYVFGPVVLKDAASLGPAVARKIADETGGRAFFAEGDEVQRHAGVDVAEAELRSEYLLMYRPKRLDHDGVFHRIVLVGPKRVRSIVGPSGFYDPAADDQRDRSKSRFP